MATNRTWCRVCGKAYDVCPHCATVRYYTPWRTICDTAQHYQIWVIVDQYKKGILDRAAAKRMLQKHRVRASDWKGYLPPVRDTVQEILKEPAAKKEEPPE